jgi:tetratricopeptide (TPR) repeat protein
MSASLLSVMRIASYVGQYGMFLAGITLTVTFTKGQRQRWPLLRRLDGQQVRIYFFGLVMVALYLVSSHFAAALEREHARKVGMARLEQPLKSLGIIYDPEDQGTDAQEEYYLLSINYVVSQTLLAEEEYTLAQIDYPNADYKVALGLFEEADEFSDIPAVQARIADCHYALGNYDSAIVNLLNVIEAIPSWSGPHYRLGMSYLHKEPPDSVLALKYLMKSCELGFHTACEQAKSLSSPRVP